MTLRTKLALWYGLLLAVILIALTGIRYAAHQKIFYNQKDYSLRVIANILEASIPRTSFSASSVQKSVARMVTDFPDIELEGVIVEAYDRSQKLVYSSSLSESERLPLRPEMWGGKAPREGHLETVYNQKETARIRILTKPVYHRDHLLYILQVGSSVQDIESALENSLWLNLLLIPIAVMLVALGGWLLTTRALRPLEAVIKTAHRISSGDLSHRLEWAQTSRETTELAKAFNHMIDRLESSFQDIRDFSDNVSHELRIPLAILKGQTELSLRRPRTEEVYRKVLESNLEEIQRMERIVERLLFLSRAGRGEIELNRTAVDLARLAEDVRSQFEVLARERDISVRAGDGEPATILGDEVLLRELLSNLVQNALTFTPAGGEIRLSVRKDKKRILLSVSDTGSGIPESEIPRIFDRFYQVDRSRAGQGSGLGLSLCKWIAEAHDATVTVQSRVGRGSEFTVSFPNEN